MTLWTIQRQLVLNSMMRNQSWSRGYSIFRQTVPPSLALRSRRCIDGVGRLQIISRYHYEREFASPKIKAACFRKDSIAESQYDLIYRATNDNYLMSCQAVVLLTLVATSSTMITYAWEEWNYRRKGEKRPDRNLPERLPDEWRDEIHAGLDKGGLSSPESRPIVNPNVFQLYEDPESEWVYMAILAVAATFLTIAIVRLQSQLPVRIYMSKRDSVNNHCIAIFYRTVIPTLRKSFEFVAGSIKPPRRTGDKRWLWSENIHVHESGKRIILMEQFFRLPSDYNRLLGYDKSPSVKVKPAKRIRQQ